MRPPTCKECVLKHYPKAYCFERVLPGGKAEYRVYESQTGPLMAIAGSAKAAWHYAYAKMVTRTP